MRKHVRALPFLALMVVPAALPLGACSEPDTPLHPGARTHSVSQPIVGGALESGLDATMAMLVDQGGGLGAVCSGTMIGTSGSSGYVLTAAHCGNLDYVLQADLYSDCDDGEGPDCRFYQVVDSQIHPNYPTGGECESQNPPAECAYDFQMLRVSGVDGNTPVIPAATDDSINNGQAITLAGYGLVNSGGNLTDSTGRRSATNTIDGFDGLAIYFSQTYTQGNGGVCFGDSGGPTYAMVGGQMQVVGVNQAVTSDYCDDFGISGRVEAVSGFIAEFMGEDPPPVTCDQCFQLEVNTSGGECADEVQTCFGNQACSDLYDCLQGCTTQACVNNCAAANQAGVDPYNAIFTCWCDTCSTECADEPSCEDPTTTDTGSTTSTDTGSTTGAGAGDTTSATGSTTGAGAGDATSTGTETGVGSGGADGKGGGDGDDDGKDDGKDDDGSSANAGDDGCSVGAAGASPQGGIWAFGLAGLAFAVASRRRRR